MLSDEEKNKILKAVENGKAYAFLEKVEIKWNTTKSNVYVFPITEEKVEKRMLSICDNATIFVTENYVLAQEKIKCKNELRYSGGTDNPISKVFIIKNGKANSLRDICKTCKYMVEELVGECRETEYKPTNKEISNFKLNGEIKNYLKIKPGYIRTREFSNEVDFSFKNIKERIEHYDKKGKWRKELNSTRKNICSDCVKYKTHTCKKGYAGYRKPTTCHYTKEELVERLKNECIKDFGSLGRAFWYFSQCGQSFEYNDPISKRVSTRYIAVPGNPAGEMDAKGFFMSFARYPFSIGEYGSREPHRYWRKEKDKQKKHINYLSEHEYRKNHQDLIEKTRYKTEYEELLLTVYAIYKHIGSTPGQSYFMDSYSNYLIYMGIKYGKVEVGIGASKCQWERTMKNLNDLFNTTVFNIEKK